MTPIKTVFVWALTVILVLFFLNASYRKLSRNEVTTGHFQEWGYGSWLLTATALLELAGAVLLLFPATATSGAVLLSLILTGATYSLLSHHVWPTSGFTSLALVLSLLLGYLRWHQSWILSVLKLNF